MGDGVGAIMSKTDKFSNLKYFVIFIAGNIMLFIALVVVVGIMKNENSLTDIRLRTKELTEKFNSRIFLRNSELAAIIADRELKLSGRNRKSDGISMPDTLEIYRYSADADIVYIMDRTGTVKQSTSYLGEDLTGENYSFRPYFTGAMAGTPRIYGAYGVTTAKRGIYFSAPIYSASGMVSGVAAVKTGMAKVEEILLDAGGPAMLITPEGIILASNVNKWVLKTYEKISPQLIESIIKDKQFPAASLTPIEIRKIGENEVVIEGKRYLKAENELSAPDWKIVLLQEKNGTGALTTLQRNMLIAGSGLIIMFFFAVIIIRMNVAAAAALRRSQGNYEEIFNSVSDAIFIFDAKTFMVKDVNRSCCEMYGFEKEKFLLNTAQSKGVPEEGYSIDKAHDYFVKASAGKPQVFEWKAKKSSGMVFWIEISLKKARIEGDEVLLAVIHDIDYRKKSQEKTDMLIEKLERSNRDLQDFAYAASHDLKEPLRMVSSYVQLIEKKYKGKLDNDADEFIGYAVNGAKNMQRLIDDMLAFSRLGTRGAEFENVDTAALIKEIETGIKFKIAEKNGVIEVFDLPVINADPTQIRQVFQNMITNALKFSKPDVPPVIKISAEKDGGFWKFAVADNGIGIDTKYYDRIFIIFQKLHPKEQYEGTGIGLTIVKKIIERHGGRVWLESMPGEGTTFYFTVKV
ncbi:MAG: PAS domain S-box protein [Spirochaetia bacterium]|nr:PAS domain S-box protein [Spirochaetia bacterium]